MAGIQFDRGDRRPIGSSSRTALLGDTVIAVRNLTVHLIAEVIVRIALSGAVPVEGEDALLLRDDLHPRITVINTFSAGLQHLNTVVSHHRPSGLRMRIAAYDDTIGTGVIQYVYVSRSVIAGNLVPNEREYHIIGRVFVTDRKRRSSAGGYQLRTSLVAVDSGRTVSVAGGRINGHIKTGITGKFRGGSTAGSRGESAITGF